MIYSGPELLKPCCSEIYDKVRPSLPREGEAHLVVGGIGKLYLNGGRTIIEGDSETNDVIDERFRVFQTSGNPKALEDALTVCREDTVVGNPLPGAYSPNFDVILINPSMVINYIIFTTLPFGQVRRLPPGLQLQMFDSENFPHYVTHEMVHWDQGNTKILTAIRASFSETEYSFDKSIDGKFPKAKSPLESEEYKRMSEGNAPGQEAQRVISGLIHQLMKLGIHDTVETIADMAAISIMRSEVKLNTPEKSPGLNLTIAHLIATLGVKEALQIFKERIDQAFVEQRSVYELI